MSKNDVSQKVKQELEGKYGGMPIGEVETAIKGFEATSMQAKKDQVLGLWYLEYTNRFRENSRYKNSEFKDYLRDLVNMPIGRYHDELFAYNAFPKDAEKYGCGFVCKVRHKVGTAKVDKVFSDISREDGKTKRNISLDKMEKILETHQPSREPRPRKGYKAMWREEQVRRKETEKRMKELETELSVALKRVEELEGEKAVFQDTMKPFLGSGVSPSAFQPAAA